MSNKDCLHFCSCIKETAAFNGTQIQTNTVFQMTAFRHSFAFRPAFMNKVAPTSLDLSKPLGKAWPDFKDEGKVHSKMKNLSFTHIHVPPNPYNLLSSEEDKSICFHEQN